MKIRHIAIAIFLLAVTIRAFGQAAVARWDWTVYTINQSSPQPKGMYPVLALPGTKIAICSSWVSNVAACTTLATSYTDATGSTPCPTSAQLTPAIGNTGCTPYADTSGGIGAYLVPGYYAYIVYASYGTFGPYAFGVDAGGAYLPIVGGTATGPIAAPTLGGITYAKQNQTGSGNNGILNSEATNAFIVADPSYLAPTLAATETETFWGTSVGASSTTVNPWTVKGLHIEDDRWGFDDQLFENWPNTNTPTGGINTNPIGDNYGPWRVNCLNTQFSPIQSGSWRLGCGNFNAVYSSPGWSLGGIGGYNWQTSDTVNFNSYNYGAGIAETLGLTQQKTSAGDNAAQYIYDYGEGGFTAPSDEGQKGLGLNVLELGSVFKGTCSTGCTTGSTQITVTPTQAEGYQGTWRYAIDLGASGSAAPYVGDVTNLTTGNGGSSIITVNTTVPVSTEWGTLAAAVNPPLVTSPPFSTSETITVNLVGGASGQFNVGDLVCFGGVSANGVAHECSKITSVAAPSGSTQAITLPLRIGHPAGVYLYANGMADYCWEQTGYTQLVSGVTYRYCLDTVGSIASNEIVVQSYFQGRINSVPFSAQVYETMNITALSCTNSACSGTINSSGTLYQPYSYNGAFLFSGATDAALNTYCTGFAWTSTTAFTCTISGLSGTYGPETATGQLAYEFNGAYAPLSQFQLWPQAEVLDVQDESLATPQVDGSLTLEPNDMPLTTASVIEEPHDSAMKTGGITSLTQDYNPYASTYGTSIDVQGAGAVNGGNGPTYVSILSLTNGQPDSYYLWDGGYATPVNGMNIEGRLAEDLLFNEFPSGAVIDVPSVPSWQSSNPNFNFDWITAPGITWAENAYTENNAIVAGGTMAMYGDTGLTLGVSNEPTTLSGSTITANNLTVTGTFTPPTTMHGIATLAAGTVTVSTTAACTPGSTCTYSLTNCGIGSSTAIGTLTLGTVTAGTSFVVNSESSTATVVTGDLSSVCWKIN